MSYATDAGPANQSVAMGPVLAQKAIEVQLDVPGSIGFTALASSPLQSANAQGVCEVVRCHVWLGQTKGATTDRGSTVRRPCLALLPG